MEAPICGRHKKEKDTLLLHHCHRGQPAHPFPSTDELPVHLSFTTSRPAAVVGEKTNNTNVDGSGKQLYVLPQYTLELLCHGYESRVWAG